jgi:acetylornithine deacetylase/succinyl-diaminopimelate desuccinylase-like protein
MFRFVANELTEPQRDSSDGRNIARAWLAECGATILAEQIELARIPAPPFEEQGRAQAIARRLTDMELASDLDEVGNLHAWFPPDAGNAAPPIVVAAHMDTVFEPGTRIDIRSEGDRWVGPGITDNARGLAVALAVLRSLRHGGVSPRHPILFAFTVGEEGRGDLRGVKHLFHDASPLRAAAAFLAVDGSGLRRIIHQALGSRRFHISVRGPGGHSWTDWGRANPANAVGEFIHSLAGLELPSEPRTTLTVARLGGGTSINAIPAESWVELDLRSESADTIQRTESRLRELADAAVDREQRRGSGELAIDWEPIGERPAGILATSHPLVSRDAGIEPQFAAASTDANVPLALGIPAIAIGSGGDSGDTHTEHEWFADSDGARGALRLFDTLATVAGF